MSYQISALMEYFCLLQNIDCCFLSDDSILFTFFYLTDKMIFYK